MKIDAHQHFWQIGKYDYVWMSPDMGVLYDSFGPAQQKTNLKECGIDKSVIVQTISSVDETRWFLQLAKENDFIAGVVGWVDLKSPCVGEILDELTDNEKLVGIRHQVHDEPDANWLLRDDVMNGLAALSRRAIPYDLLIRPVHLDVSLTIAQKFPDLPLVIDHIAKPCIAKNQWNDWANGMAALSGCDNVFCKLSGMITEADWTTWKPGDLKPYMDYLIEKFGPERCMFGSDWPVCLLAGSYKKVFEAFNENIMELSPSEKSELLGGAAARFYNLEV
jgi:L-fuconolactonase